MKTAKFIMITLTLIFITTFSVTGTVLSRSRDLGDIDAQSRRTIENQYVAQIRAQLKQQGYDNAGITMTRVTEENGRNDYQVLIHHRRMNKLSVWEKNILTDYLGETVFPLENSVITFDFLKN